jgi:hypothetical protein
MPPPFAASRVPVIPNASRVHGRLQRVEAEPGGAIWHLHVAGAADVPDHPNFVRDRVGQTISLYVPEGMAPPVAAGDAVEAEVAFRGDERGGRFVAVGDGARKR